MAKHKKKDKAASPPSTGPHPDVVAEVTDESEVPEAQAVELSSQRLCRLTSRMAPRAGSRRTVRRGPVGRGGMAAVAALDADPIKVALALVVIGIAAAIWYQPPLVKASFPYVSYALSRPTC